MAARPVAVIRSANEISGLVIKAVRGAGLPLGLAEDLALAIPAHVAGPPEAALIALERYLAAPVPLLAHVAALDLAVAGGQSLPETACPCLAALAACHGGALAESRGVPSVVVDADLWARLEQWAARTYVPASEASRQAGAGAGLTDND